MSNDSKAFKKTGRNVTVSREDLINVMIERLMKYDSMTPADRKRHTNPYEDAMYTKVAGGKTVQIPRLVQNMAIVKWDAMKRQNRAGPRPVANDQTPHTRLYRTAKYASRDPFVMNRDLRAVNPDDGAFEDIPEDRDLSNVRRRYADNRGAVGGADVPDQRYGRGGSYGDLPRDYQLFRERIERDVPDKPFDSDLRGRRGYIQPVEEPDNLGREIEHSHSYINDYDSHARRSVGRNSLRRRGPQQYENEMIHATEPVHGDVSSLDNEVLVESDAGDSEGVEHYAPIDDDEPVERPEHVMDYSTSDCGSGSCRASDDGYLYRGQRQHRIPGAQDEDKFEIDDEDYEEYIEYDEDEPVVDEPVVDEHVEHYEGSISNEDMYKYMFYLLLIAVIVYVIYTKRSGRQTA